MQRVFIIHGWEGNPEKDWMPWAKEELTKKGYQVIVPDMPDSANPRVETWIQKIKEVVGTPQPTDILVGHSIGCQAILRYMETMPEGTRFGKIIFIAPWVTLTEEATPSDEDKLLMKSWTEDPVDYAMIRGMAGVWTAVFSDDDPWVKYDDNYKIFEEELGAKIILKTGLGHFSAEDGVGPIPFLLELI